MSDLWKTVRKMSKIVWKLRLTTFSFFNWQFLSFSSLCRLKFGSLKTHIMTIHENKPRNGQKFVCEICAKVCTSSSSFTAHAWTHMDEDTTKIQCNICDKWLKNRYILQMHKQVHENNPLKCHHCGKIKQNLRSLRSHVATVHAKRKHQCTICDKSFTRAVTLKVYFWWKLSFLWFIYDSWVFTLLFFVTHFFHNRNTWHLTLVHHFIIAYTVRNHSIAMEININTCEKFMLNNGI